MAWAWTGNHMDNSRPTKRLKTAESEEEAELVTPDARQEGPRKRTPSIGSGNLSGFRATTPSSVARAPSRTEEPEPSSEISSTVVYPARPDVVKFVNAPKSHYNHTYRNFSNMPVDRSYTFPVNLSSMSFHEKLYHLLSTDNIGHRQSINWCPEGRSFEITSPQKLVRFGILHAYFGYGMMQQFRKELNKYGYKQLARDTGSLARYYSEVSSTL